MQTQPQDLQDLQRSGVDGLRRSTTTRRRPTASPAEWRPVQRRLRPPAALVPALLEALVWLAAAVVLRLLADTVLLALPQLWLPVAVVLLTPAAIAIALSTWAPPLSALLGYRLILIAMGLVLGGRL